MEHRYLYAPLEELKDARELIEEGREHGNSAGAAKAEQVSLFLQGLFAVSDPSESKGETITARELLDEGAERVERELAADRRVLSAGALSPRAYGRALLLALGLAWLAALRGGERR